jgi:predicted MFS family arabinose efflux permease
MNNNKRKLYQIPLVLVFIITTLLLSYIGYVESKQQYLRFQVLKLVTQGDTIRNPTRIYLNAGLPLKHFSALNSFSKNLLDSDRDIHRIQIHDESGKVLFDFLQDDRNRISTKVEASGAEELLFESFRLKVDVGDSILERSTRFYQVSLPIQSKFGTAGKLILQVSKQKLLQLHQDFFVKVFYFLAFLTLVFIFAAAMIQGRPDDKKKKTKLLKRLYFSCFLLLAIFISIVVYQVYRDGALGSSRALSSSMAMRLNAVTEKGIDLNDIVGIDNTFEKYKKAHPHILSIALVNQGTYINHNDSNMVGETYRTPRDCFIDRRLIRGKNDSLMEVVISVPRSVVTRPLFKGLRAFIVLLIACGLVSLFFLEVGTALSGMRKNDNHDPSLPREADTGTVAVTGHEVPGNEDEWKENLSLALIKPAYFTMVFLKGLSAAFLPQLVYRLALESGGKLTSTSIPFTLYYLAFALVMIPAGYFAQRGHLKKMMLAGCLFLFTGLMIFTMFEDFVAVTVAQIFLGAGQGAFLIGMQSFIMAVTPLKNRTEGNAVKVISKNAGSISGSSIGALLFAYLEYYQLLFGLATLISLFMLVYLWKLVPNIDAGESQQFQENYKKKPPFSFSSILSVLKDREFTRTLIFISYFSKIAVTGVVLFALPFILEEMGFQTDSIGQILMLFYISAMVTTHFISRYVDRFGSTRLVLTISALLGGGGIILLGILTNQEAGSGCMVTQVGHSGEMVLGIMVVATVCLIGLSFGMSSAPIYTHIDSTAVARDKGNKMVAASYTFLERGGHVLGPLLISQLFVLFSHSMSIIIYGSVMAIMGILFLLPSSSTTRLKDNKISLMLLSIIILICFSLTYDYFKIKTALHQEANKIARSDIARAGKEVDNQAEMLVKNCHQLADRLTGNTIVKKDMQAELKKMVETRDELNLFGVGYARVRKKSVVSRTLLDDPTIGLDWQYMYWSQQHNKALSLTGNYDYTNEFVPGNEWYLQPVKHKKPFWKEPMYGKASWAVTTGYSVPFFTTLDKKEVAGVAHMNYSFREFKKIADEMDIRRNGFSVIFSKKGNLIYHPDPGHVNMKRIPHGERGHRKQHCLMARLSIDSQVHQWPLFLQQFIETDIDGQKYWTQDYLFSGEKIRVYFRSIANSDWTMAVVYFLKELTIDDSRLSKLKFQMIMGYAIFFVCLIFNLFYHPGSSNRQYWFIAISISLVLLSGIFFIWNENLSARLYAENRNKIKNVKMLNKLKGKIRDRRVQLRGSEPIFIPTGVFVYSIAFNKATEVEVTGFVWQKYRNRDFKNNNPLSSPLNKKTIGIIFPDSVDDSIKLTGENYNYRKKVGDTIIYGWYFKFLLRQQFGYLRYPFDLEEVWLRMRFLDYEKNAVLIPDFTSYHFINESALPGVEQNDFVLPGWSLVGSYFDHRLNHYASDLGVTGSNYESYVDELYFNVNIKRDFIESFVSNITPLLMIYITLFVLMVLSTGDHNRANRSGFNSFAVLGAIVGLFFSTMYLHAELRAGLVSSGVSYLECFYIFSYVLMIIIIINGSIVSSQANIPWINDNNNRLPKLLFWPFVTCVIFMVSLFMLPV